MTILAGNEFLRLIITSQWEVGGAKQERGNDYCLTGRTVWRILTSCTCTGKRSRMLTVDDVTITHFLVFLLIYHDNNGSA